MVADQCTTIRANWSVPEGPCTDLSYNVTLLSSNGTKLQGPFKTRYTVYNFTVEAFDGIVNVTIVPMNDDARGAPFTNFSVIGMG